MAYIRTKTVKGHKYYYLVEGKREGKKVRQRVLGYLGTREPSERLVVDLKRKAGQRIGSVSFRAPMMGNSQKLEAAKSEIHRSFELFGLDVRYDLPGDGETAGVVHFNSVFDAVAVRFVADPPLRIMLHELGHVFDFNMRRRANPADIEDGVDAEEVANECSELARRIYWFEDSLLNDLEMRLEEEESLSRQEQDELEGLRDFFEQYADTYDEGFANAFAWFVLDPEAAKQHIPNMCDRIEGLLVAHIDLRDCLARVQSKCRHV